MVFLWKKSLLKKTLVVFLLINTLSLFAYKGYTTDNNEPEEETTTVTENLFGEKPKEKSVLHKVVFYIPNRALDLLDCVRANISLGFGIGGNVRATKALQIGAAIYDTSRFGLSNNRLRLIYHEWSVESGISLAYARLSNQTREYMEVGATIHVGVIGAEVAANPNEIADFFFGWFMYDYQEDDI